MDFSTRIGLTSLQTATGIEPCAMGQRQLRARHNIKYCANDQWQYVNSYYDEKSAGVRAYMLDPRALFRDICELSLENVYDHGATYFGTSAQAYLKDIRFCGNDFLHAVVFYYTVKLIDDAFDEVDGTEADAERILETLNEMKKEYVK